MLRERGRLTLSDFAKVAAHSALLKARVESKWHRVASSPHQTIPRVRERDLLFTSPKGFIVRTDELLTAFVELEAAVEPFSASSFL